jgi:uncharacterized protein YecT (DUF1311 family)
MNHQLVAAVIVAGLSGIAFTQVLDKKEEDPSTTQEARDALGECYAEIGEKPRLALDGCLKKKKAKASSEMHFAIKKMHASISDIDSSEAPQAKNSLEESQKAFQVFVKKECQRVRDLTMGGSGAGDMQSSCEIDWMRIRAKSLAT